MRRFVVRVIACVLFLVMSASASAQAIAQLGGRVADQSGAVLPGVTVTATQTDTGLTRTVVTDGDGSYQITNLPTGPYRLEVMLQGFRTYVQTGIVLQVDANASINVTMAVGELAETVSVEAAAPLVDVRSSGISDVVENERIVELPLQGRQRHRPGGPRRRGGATGSGHARRRSADQPSRSQAASRTACRICSTAPCTTTRQTI